MVIMLKARRAHLCLTLFVFVAVLCSCSAINPPYATSYRHMIIGARVVGYGVQNVQQGTAIALVCRPQEAVKSAGYQGMDYHACSDLCGNIKAKYMSIWYSTGNTECKCSNACTPWYIFDEFDGYDYYDTALYERDPTANSPYHHLLAMGTRSGCTVDGNNLIHQQDGERDDLNQKEGHENEMSFFKCTKICGNLNAPYLTYFDSLDSRNRCQCFTSTCVPTSSGPAWWSQYAEITIFQRGTILTDEADDGEAWKTANDVKDSDFVHGATAGLRAQAYCRGPGTEGGGVITPQSDKTEVNQHTADPSGYELDDASVMMYGVKKTSGKIPAQLRAAAEKGDLFHLPHLEHTFDTLTWNGPSDIDAWCTEQYRLTPNAIGVFSLKTRCSGIHKPKNRSSRNLADQWSYEPYQFIRAMCWPVFARNTEKPEILSDVLNAATIRAQALPRNSKIKMGNQNTGGFQGSSRPGLFAGTGEHESNVPVFSRITVLNSPHPHNSAVIGVENGGACACLKECIMPGYEQYVGNMVLHQTFQLHNGLLFNGLLGSRRRQSIETGFATCDKRAARFSNVLSVDTYRMNRRRLQPESNGGVLHDLTDCPFGISPGRRRNAMTRHDRGTRGDDSTFPFYWRGNFDATRAKLWSEASYIETYNEDPIIHSLTGFCNEVAAATYMYNRPSTGIPGMPNAWHSGIFTDFKARTLVPLEHGDPEVTYRESHRSKDSFPHEFCAADGTTQTYYDKTTFDECSSECKKRNLAFMIRWLSAVNTMVCRCQNTCNRQVLEDPNNLEATLKIYEMVKSTSPLPVYYENPYQRRWTNAMCKNPVASKDSSGAMTLGACITFCSSYRAIYMIFWDSNYNDRCQCAHVCDKSILDEFSQYTNGVAIYQRDVPYTVINNGGFLPNTNSPDSTRWLSVCRALCMDHPKCDAFSIASSIPYTRQEKSASTRTVLNTATSANVPDSVEFRYFGPGWNDLPPYNAGSGGITTRWPSYKCYLLQRAAAWDESSCYYMSTSQTLQVKAIFKEIEGSQVKLRQYVQTSNMIYNENPTCTPGNTVYEYYGVMNSVTDAARVLVPGANVVSGERPSFGYAPGTQIIEPGASVYGPAVYNLALGSSLVDKARQCSRFCAEFKKLDATECAFVSAMQSITPGIDACVFYNFFSPIGNDLQASLSDAPYKLYLVGKSCNSHNSDTNGISLEQCMQYCGQSGYAFISYADVLQETNCKCSNACESPYIPENPQNAFNFAIYRQNLQTMPAFEIPHPWSYHKEYVRVDFNQKITVCDDSRADSGKTTPLSPEQAPTLDSCALACFPKMYMAMAKSGSMGFLCLCYDKCHQVPIANTGYSAGDVAIYRRMSNVAVSNNAFDATLRTLKMDDNYDFMDVLRPVTLNARNAPLPVLAAELFPDEARYGGALRLCTLACLYRYNTGCRALALEKKTESLPHCLHFGDIVNSAVGYITHPVLEPLSKQTSSRNVCSYTGDRFASYHNPLLNEATNNEVFVRHRKVSSVSECALRCYRDGSVPANFMTYWDDGSCECLKFCASFVPFNGPQRVQNYVRSEQIVTAGSYTAVKTGYKCTDSTQSNARTLGGYSLAAACAKECFPSRFMTHWVSGQCTCADRCDSQSKYTIKDDQYLDYPTIYDLNAESVLVPWNFTRPTSESAFSRYTRTPIDNRACSSAVNHEGIASTQDCVRACALKRYMIMYYGKDSTKYTCSCADTCSFHTEQDSYVYEAASVAIDGSTSPVQVADDGTLAPVPAGLILSATGSVSSSHALPSKDITYQSYAVEHPANHMNARFGPYECALPCERGLDIDLVSANLQQSETFNDVTDMTAAKLLRSCASRCSTALNCAGFRVSDRLTCNLYIGKASTTHATNSNIVYERSELSAPVAPFTYCEQSGAEPVWKSTEESFFNPQKCSTECANRRTKFMVISSAYCVCTNTCNPQTYSGDPALDFIHIYETRFVPERHVVRITRPHPDSAQVWTYVTRVRTATAFEDLGAGGYTCKGATELRHFTMQPFSDHLGECERACVDDADGKCGAFGLEGTDRTQCVLFTPCHDPLEHRYARTRNPMYRFFRIAGSVSVFTQVSAKYGNSIACASEAMRPVTEAYWAIQTPKRKEDTLLHRCAELCKQNMRPLQGLHSGCVGFTITLSARRCRIYANCDATSRVAFDHFDEGPAISYGIKVQR